jgi:hypothetical protein
MPSSTYPDGLNALEKASVVSEGDIETGFTFNVDELVKSIGLPAGETELSLIA